LLRVVAILSDNETSRELRYHLMKLRERFPQKLTVFMYDVSRGRIPEGVRRLPVVEIDGIRLEGEEALGAIEEVGSVLEDGLTPTPALVLRRLRKKREEVIVSAREAVRALRSVEGIVPEDRRTPLVERIRRLEDIATGLFGYSSTSINSARREVEEALLLAKRLVSEAVESALVDRLGAVSSNLRSALESIKSSWERLGIPGSPSLLASLLSRVETVEGLPSSPEESVELLLSLTESLSGAIRELSEVFAEASPAVVRVTEDLPALIRASSKLDALSGSDWFSRFLASKLAALVSSFYRSFSGERGTIQRFIRDVRSVGDLSKVVDAVIEADPSLRDPLLEIISGLTSRVSPGEASFRDIAETAEALRALIPAVPPGPAIDEIASLEQRASRLSSAIERLGKVGVDVSSEREAISSIISRLKEIRSKAELGGEFDRSELELIEDKLNSLTARVREKI